MKKGQSAVEAAILIGFMSFALIIVLVVSYQKLNQVQVENDQKAVVDVISIIESELNLASRANDGYYREFELPSTTNGRDYTVSFIGTQSTNANFTEIEIKLSNSTLAQSSITPYNVFGVICKGKNVITRSEGIVNISCSECSNKVDDDFDGCIDYPQDLGCTGPSMGVESQGGCMTECSDSLDNDGNGCADSPADSGCIDGADADESGGSCQCADGTPYGSCDGSGKFCSNGVIVDSCGPPNNCACAQGFTCQGNVCVSAVLSCQVASSCASSALLRLSGTTDSHAEIASLNNYGSIACCAYADSISTSCASPETKVVSLSANTDAHIEKPGQSDYPVDVCLSATGSNTFSCGYFNVPGNGFAACTAAGFDTCVVTMSDFTNAHVSDCVTDPYDVKVCCKTNVVVDAPPVISNGQPTGDIATRVVTLMVTTDETATCRYSTTAGTAYDSMTSTFTTTGGTSHSQSVSGLTNGVKNYYVRCSDSSGNKNQNDYAITFTVQAPILLCHFDNTKTCVDGENPSDDQANSFSPGKIGQGIDIKNNPSRLAYAMSGNFEKTQGTVEFWLKPHWSGASGGNKNLFRIKTQGSMPEASTGIYVVTWSHILYFGVGNGNSNFLTQTADITAWDIDSWHHIAFSFQQGGKMKAYVDGVFKGEVDYTYPIMPSDTALGDQILVSKTESYGLPTFEYADAVYDELTIYDYVRTPAQIAQDAAV